MEGLNFPSIEKNLPTAINTSSPVSKCWGRIVQSYTSISNCSKNIDKHGFSILVHLAYSKGLNHFFEETKIINENIAVIVNLLSALENQLMPLIFILYERLKFYHRIRGLEEPVVNYLLSLVCLADYCEFDVDKDHQIKEQCLNYGDLGTSLREKLICEPDFNVNKLLLQITETDDSGNCVKITSDSAEVKRDLLLKNHPTKSHSHRNKSLNCEVTKIPTQKTSPKQQLQPNYQGPKNYSQNTGTLQRKILANKNKDKWPHASLDPLLFAEKPKKGDNSFVNTCIHCKKVYSTELALITHMKSHICVCELCGMKFTFCHELSNHLQDHTELKRSGQIFKQQWKNKQTYSCPICQKIIYGKRKFNHHKMRKCDVEYRYNKRPTSLEIKPYECTQCSRTFNRKWDLKIHGRTHDPLRKKNHVCDVCGKEFFRIFELIRHQKLHTGDKSYTCEICGKAFTTASYLNGHRYLHSGEKQHTCDVCGKSFAQKSNLVSHMTMHNQTKDHKCELCNKYFSRKCYLKPHIKAHLKEKPFGCEVCGAQFGYKFSLNRHLLIHSGTKPFECILCSKKFLWESTYKLHKRHHEGT